MRADLSLPLLGLGTAHLGELFHPVPEAQSRATLETAWDEGIRYFDTAPWYGRGLAEHRLGGFLRTCPRGDFTVSTKVGRTLHRPADPAAFDRSPWAGGLRFEVAFDYGYDGVMRSYEQALQRLGLDTIDALVIHDLDAGYHAPPELYAAHRRDLAEGGMKALDELKSSGQIRAIGMGVNSNERFETAVPEVHPDFVLVAVPYTLLDHQSLHRGMAECQRRGISVVIGAPYASGILVTGSVAGARYAYGAVPETVQARVRGIEAVARAHGVALPAATLQFVLAHPAVVSVIPGAAAPDEVRQTVAHLAAPIPSDFWSDLKGKGLILSDAPVPGAD
ncbi:MAG: aldo/keto reductase [Rubellimicrobium sp.]|nr:aldo/keto reductase [Rubellimicrobium sp.]